MLSVLVSMGEGKAILIDPPLFADEAHAIAAFARKAGLGIWALIVSHAHGDHSYGMAHFPGVPVVAHRTFWEFYQKIRPIDEEFFRKAIPGYEPPGSRRPNILVEERLGISFRRKILIFHAPGHSPDGLLVEIEGEGIWIAGDTVIPVPLISSGSLGKLRRTLEDLLAHWRGETIVPGHGEIMEGGAARGALVRNLEYLEVLEKAVTEALGAGKGLPELEAMPLDRFGISPKDVGGLASWIHHENLRRAYEELSGRG